MNTAECINSKLTFFNELDRLSTVCDNISSSNNKIIINLISYGALTYLSNTPAMAPCHPCQY